MNLRGDVDVRHYALGLLAVLLTASLTGCIGGAGDDVLEATGVDTTERREIGYSATDRFDLGVGACTVAGEVAINACTGNRVLLETRPEGTVQAADLELSWEAENPLMEELGITLAWACGGNSCQTEWASGTSPVELTVDGIDEEGKLYMLVWTPSPGTEEAYLDYATPQDVEVAGTFTSLVPAGATSGT